MDQLFKPGVRKISIIVPCRNEADAIEPFLRSLLSQDFTGFDWEVIIADGMSDDGTRGLVAKASRTCAAIRIVDNPARTVSAGLNSAIRDARGDFILRMDVHTEYAPDYVRKCVETLDQTGADNVGGPARTRASGWMPEAIAAAYHSPFSCGGARFHNDGYEGFVDTVTYGCWKKDTLLRLGMFDENLVRNQDDELNFRTIRAGGKIWQSPAIVSWYRPRRNLDSLFRQYFQYGFWKVAVQRKHGRPASYRHLIPGCFVLTIAGLPMVALIAFLFGFDGAGRVAFDLWLTIACAYVLSCCAAAISCIRRVKWRSAPILPVVFATYHVSYGAGFMTGLAYWPMQARSSVPMSDAFTKLSR